MSIELSPVSGHSGAQKAAWVRVRRASANTAPVATIGMSISAYSWNAGRVGLFGFVMIGVSFAVSATSFAFSTCVGGASGAGGAMAGAPVAVPSLTDTGVGVGAGSGAAEATAVTETRAMRVRSELTIRRR